MKICATVHIDGGMGELIPMPDDACEIRMVHPDKVETVREALVPYRDAERLAERFKLLADAGPTHDLRAVGSR